MKPAGTMFKKIQIKFVGEKTKMYNIFIYGRYIYTRYRFSSSGYQLNCRGHI